MTLLLDMPAMESVDECGEGRFTELGHPVCAAVEGTDQARKGGDRMESDGRHGDRDKVDTRDQRSDQRE